MNTGSIVPYMSRTLAVAVAVAFVTSAGCGGTPRRDDTILPPPCKAKPELPDALDAATGLAPIPRGVPGDPRPSGNIYWRQMRAAPISKLENVSSLVAHADKLCEVAHETACWKLPFKAFQVVVVDRDPENLVTPLKATELEALSNEPRQQVPAEIQAAFAAAGQVVQIEAGPRLVCARFASGQVQCLSTEAPRTPPSASDFPTTPTPIRDVFGKEITAQALSVGGAACAITKDARVVCWGHIPQAAAFPACDG